MSFTQLYGDHCREDRMVNSRGRDDVKSLPTPWASPNQRCEDKASSRDRVPDKSRNRERSRSPYHREEGQSSSRERDSRDRGYFRRERDEYRPSSRSEKRDDYSQKEVKDKLYSSRFRTDPDHKVSNTIIIKNLPLTADESFLWGLLLEINVKPKDIRILRRRESGQSRGFGFVEFTSEKEAFDWMEQSKGYLKVDQRHTAELQYSAKPDMPIGASEKMIKSLSNDWICSEVSGIPTEPPQPGVRMEDDMDKDRPIPDSDKLGISQEGLSEIGMVPCDTLLLRNLAKFTNEDTIQTHIQRAAVFTPVRILIARDSVLGTSRGFAYIQLRSVQESMQLLTTLTAIKRLTIQGRDILVSYAKQSLTAVIGTVAEVLNQNPNAVFTQAARINPAVAAQEAVIRAQVQKQREAALLRGQISAATHQQLQLAAAANVVASSPMILSTAGGMQFVLPHLQGSSLVGNANIANILAEQQLLAAAKLQQERDVATLSALSGLPIVTGAHSILPNLASAPPVIPTSVATALGAPLQVQSTSVPLPQPQQEGGKVKQLAAKQSLGVVQTPHGELPRYPPPDTSKYQYEETSGLYYDPVTGLYYDSNSQYYYNGDTQQWLYWDARYETYLPPPTKEGTEGDGKSKKEKDKQEKVKVAKKIQKDMERWAKQLNEKKGGNKAAEFGTIGTDEASKLSASADAAFSVLETHARHHSASVASTSASLPGAGLVAYDGDSDEEKERTASAKDSIGATSSLSCEYSDWSKMACLLCKRRFASKDALTRHNNLSDLHKANLEAAKKQEASEPAMLSLDSESYQYRDRAKERRDKFGLDEAPTTNRFKEQYLDAKQQATSSVVPVKESIGEENIGNKLLKSMGWKEGQGLGKANQGIVDPIQAERRAAGAGLGAADSASLETGGRSYAEQTKEALRRFLS